MPRDSKNRHGLAKGTASSTSDGSDNGSMSKMSKRKMRKRNKTKKRRTVTFGGGGWWSKNNNNTTAAAAAATKFEHTEGDRFGASSRTPRKRAPRKRTYQRRRSQVAKNKNFAFSNNNSTLSTSSTESRFKRYYRTRTKTGKLPASAASFAKEPTSFGEGGGGGNKSVVKRRRYKRRSQMHKTHPSLHSRNIFYRSLSSSAGRPLTGSQQQQQQASTTTTYLNEVDDRRAVESINQLLESEQQDLLTLYTLFQKEEIDLQKKENAMLIHKVENLYDNVLYALEKLVLD